MCVQFLQLVTFEMGGLEAILYGAEVAGVFMLLLEIGQNKVQYTIICEQRQIIH